MLGCTVEGLEEGSQDGSIEGRYDGATVTVMDGFDVYDGRVEGIGDLEGVLVALV